MNQSIRTLSIGNSFSQDACAYIHEQAKTMGIEFETINLYIGGCSLATHWENWDNDRKNYSLEQNGKTTGKMVSIRDALTDGTYSVITLQQASHDSGKRDTYHPYMEKLAAVVKEYQPDTKLMVHQTWAYETDSTHGAFPDYNKSQGLMYTMLNECYTEAAEKIGAPLLPTGDAVQYFRENVPEFDYGHGGLSLNRDGFHLSIPYGRYLAGLLWIHEITKLVSGKAADISSCTFVPDSENSPCSRQLLDTIRMNLQTFFALRSL